MSIFKVKIKAGKNQSGGGEGLETEKGLNRVASTINGMEGGPTK